MWKKLAAGLAKAAIWAAGNTEDILAIVASIKKVRK